MDVTRTNGINSLADNNIRIAGYSERVLQGTVERSNATLNSEPSFMIEISEEGRLASMLIKEFDLTDITALKVDEGLLSAQGPLADREKPMYEQRQVAFLSGTPLELDPLDNEFMIAGVRHNFHEGTLERFITETLDDKARNSSMVALELGKMIKSAAYSNGETVEERATNREIGMSHAKYIADTYFDNPEEAQVFLDEINRYYEKDILREKGYMVFDNLDTEPYRSYAMPNAPEGYVNGKAMLVHFGASDEVMGDPEKAVRFLTNQLGKMLGGQWQKDVAEAWEENEKKVASIIDEIRASVLNENDIANSLAKILKAF